MIGTVADPSETGAATAPGFIGTRALSKLKWRCRRGLLENDLLIERFFVRHESAITVAQAEGLRLLMDLADHDLLDLLLRRREIDGELDRPEVRDVLQLLRTPQTPQ